VALVLVGLTVAAGALSGAGGGATSAPVPTWGSNASGRTGIGTEVDLPEETVDVEPEADYETSGDAGNMTAEWTWGDGRTSAGTIAPGPSPVMTGTYAYSQAGTYAVTVTITGPDGAATSSAAAVVVGAEAASGGAPAVD
jgi:hypothetical protein